MGAFDSYAATARCPSCRDVHWLSGQTKFFVPDFFGLYHRHFTPGVAQPIDVDPDELTRARVWDDEWLRIDEPGDPGTLRLLVDFDELHCCTCGTAMAIVLCFRLVGASATLERAEIVDALADPRALAVDFAEHLPGLWTGDFATFRAALAEFAAAPHEVRRARLREALAARFDGPFPDTEPPWTSAAAPARCEACGDTRERDVFTLLSHPDYPGSFFGPGWSGGVLRPGAVLAGDLSWLAEDRDRGYWVRLRHPVPEDSLRLITRPYGWGCRCGAGQAASVLHFVREAAALRFAAMTLRVVRGAGDLADLDFVEAPRETRDPPPQPWPRWCPASREEAIAAILSGHWGVSPPRGA